MKKRDDLPQREKWFNSAWHHAGADNGHSNSSVGLPGALESQIFFIKSLEN
jgi:hypothetical protein